MTGDGLNSTSSLGQPRHGYTLVELLVVIMIITVLLALLMPSLGRYREMARRASCGSNLHQLHVATVTYAVSNRRHYPARNLGASRYAGGLHDDTLPVASPDHWGRRWEGYIPALGFDGEGAELLFCPSIRNFRGAWRPDWQPLWRNSDYAYWPTIDVPISRGGVSWIAGTLPPWSMSSGPSRLPIWGDSLMEYWKFGSKWFVSAHTADQSAGHNSYAENLPYSSEPAGGNQAHADGSVAWYFMDEMQRAVHMWSWGADGAMAFQSWAHR